MAFMHRSADSSVIRVPRVGTLWAPRGWWQQWRIQNRGPIPLLRKLAWFLRDARSQGFWKSAQQFVQVIRPASEAERSQVENLLLGYALPIMRRTLSLSGNGSARETLPVSVIIPTRDGFRLIETLLLGLSRTVPGPREVIVVDTGSRDPRVWKLYDQFREALCLSVVEEPGPFNYSRACNRGAERALGDWLLFLNNDIEVVDDRWLSRLMVPATLPAVGVVGPTLLYPNGVVQHAGVAIVGNGLNLHLFRGCRWETIQRRSSSQLARRIAAVTGACQLIRKTAFNAVGGYDEQFELVYSDLALCLQISRVGWDVVYEPNSVLIHHEGITRGTLKEEETGDLERFRNMLERLGFIRDPYFEARLSERDPNLRLRGPVEIGAESKLRVAA